MKRLAVLLAAALALAGCAAQADSTQQVRTLVAPSCVKPTGSITNAKLLAYMECRFDNLGTVAPVPTPTPTPAPSPSAAPTPTPTPTPTPSPTPTPTPSAPATTPVGEFPNAGNTGPTGTLTAYTGPTTISTPNAVIDSKTIGSALTINATGVIIRNSRLNSALVVTGGGSVTVVDSLVDGSSVGVNYSAIFNGNLTLRRTEVVGGVRSLECSRGNCLIEDSWLHGQLVPAGSDAHGDGFLNNGGNTGSITLRHNTLSCDSPRMCSGSVAMYGDFGPVRDTLIEGNLFKASQSAAYCLYGGNLSEKPFKATNVDIVNNTFERGPNGKCAFFGVWTGLPTDSLSTVTGNRWDDGTPLNP